MNEPQPRHHRMKSSAGMAFGLMLFFVICSASTAVAWEGMVVRVLDGDSIQVERNGKTYELRLYGIDTPEYKQAYSNKAKQYTKRLVLGKPVAVEEMDIDRYGRIVALVSCQGELVNRELVQAGLAWHYPRYCRREPLCTELAGLERSARKQKRGLWQDTEPVAPWEWKRRQKMSGSKRGSGWSDRFGDWW